MKLVGPQIVFLDNSKVQTKNVMRQCPRIKVIKVGDSGETPVKVSFSHPDFINLLNKVGNSNTYYKAMSDVYFRTLKADNYDKLSGIQDAEMNYVIKWINSSPASPHFLVVDFDRTLTMFEGIITERGGIDAINKRILSEASHLLPVTIEDAVTYLCGGKERLEKLRSFFGYMKKLNATIIVLTNNGTCNSDPQLMHGYLDAIIGPDSYKLVCSRDVVGGNKGMAFATMKVLRGLCGVYLTRKKRHHTRRTRRRINRRQ